MTFWHFAVEILNRLPGWPNEKQLVMLTTFVMGFMMLIMAQFDHALWTVELFKTLITVVIVTGCINMILAFYFTANKSDEARNELDQTRADNTNKAFDAIKASVEAQTGGSTDPHVLKEGDTVTLEKGQ